MSKLSKISKMYNKKLTCLQMYKMYKMYVLNVYNAYNSQNVEHAFNVSYRSKKFLVGYLVSGKERGYEETAGRPLSSAGLYIACLIAVLLFIFSTLKA